MAKGITQFVIINSELENGMIDYADTVQDLNCDKIMQFSYIYFYS